MPHAAFRAFVDAHDDFLILSHIDPDGDAVGSSLGLSWALRPIGKRVTVANDSPLPASLRFLPGWEEVRLASELPGPFGAVFVLDCSSLDRVGRSGIGAIAPGAAIACVDHHAGTDGFGDPRLVNVSASATAELIVEILQACELPIGPEAAACLYAGIASDTGAFRF
ncbi:MAG TPA: DHH family phosphoesterase, partial [Candidatus Eisenbacteria bacterium]|nr:DHH family phosphoesterase [Candidatus Eisenbacteria bacterium]